MTDHTDQLRKEIVLVNNVLAVRGAALHLALEDINAGLYHTAVSNDDAGILEYFEGLLAEAADKAEKLKAALNDIGTFDDHMSNLARVAQHDGHIKTLEFIRGLAQANVDFGTSNEVCYPPTSKSTAQLLTELAVMERKLRAAEEAEETAQV